MERRGCFKKCPVDVVFLAQHYSFRSGFFSQMHRMHATKIVKKIPKGYGINNSFYYYAVSCNKKLKEKTNIKMNFVGLT